MPQLRLRLPAVGAWQYRFAALREAGRGIGAMAIGTDIIPDWRLTGDWWDLCNCAIGCPCNFGSNPTYGFCEGVLTWLIREGNYGDLGFTKDLAVVLII